MKTIFKTIIATTALAASLSIANAKSVDGYGSNAINDIDFKKAVALIVQDKVCDGFDTKRAAFSHLNKASAANKISVPELMILANKRSETAINRWRIDADRPILEDFVCKGDLDFVARTGHFGLSRIATNIPYRIEVGREASRMRDLAVKYRALKEAERAGCLSEDKAYKAGVVTASFNDQMRKSAYDPYRAVYAAWSRDQLDVAKSKAYGDLDTCHLADKLLSKQR